VNLVDEQHVSFTQMGQDGGQVAGALDRRPCGDANVDVHLVGDDVGEGGLPQAGRSIQQDVINGLMAAARCLDQDAHIFHDALLAGHLVEASRAQGVVEAVFGFFLATDHAAGVGHAFCSFRRVCWMEYTGRGREGKGLRWQGRRLQSAAYGPARRRL